MFAKCAGECPVCGCAGFCLAGNDDDDFYPASKEDVIERLLQDKYPSYRGMMINYLQSEYGYTFDLKDIGTKPREKPEWDPITDEDVAAVISEVFGNARRAP